MYFSHHCKRKETRKIRGVLVFSPTFSHTKKGVPLQKKSLYEAGIKPTAAAKRISRPRYQRLAEEIKSVLAKAIKAGGTTLNDFTQTDGKPGYFRHELQVYGREGEACYRCGEQIKSKVIGQRNTFYCGSCQKS